MLLKLNKIPHTSRSIWQNNARILHIIEIEDTPQQRGTVDCGVAVLYTIMKYFEQVPISRAIGEEELPEMRTEIVKAHLNWARDMEYYEDQLMKRTRVA